MYLGGGRDERIHRMGRTAVDLCGPLRGLVTKRPYTLFLRYRFGCGSDDQLTDGGQGQLRAIIYSAFAGAGSDACPNAYRHPRGVRTYVSVNHRRTFSVVPF
jgi:hypothetical protein